MDKQNFALGIEVIPAFLKIPVAGEKPLGDQPTVSMIPSSQAVTLPGLWCGAYCDAPTGN
jgi:hypothetical protein